MTLDNRLARAVREGDRVAVLVERMRRGDRSVLRCRFLRSWATEHSAGACDECQGTGRAPFRSAVELAAYAGDEAARAVLGEDCSCGFAPEDSAVCLDDPMNASDWLAGLARWPGALERAALFACAAWLESLDERMRYVADYEPMGELWRRGRAAIQAARAHLDAPTEATREACRQHTTAGNPVGRLCGYLLVPDVINPANGPRYVIQDCADMAGEATVLAAAKRGLVAWALTEK